MFCVYEALDIYIICLPHTHTCTHTHTHRHTYTPSCRQLMYFEAISNKPCGNQYNVNQLIKMMIKCGASDNWASLHFLLVLPESSLAVCLSVDDGTVQIVDILSHQIALSKNVSLIQKCVHTPHGFA